MRSRILVASVAMMVVAFLWIGCSKDTPVDPGDTAELTTGDVSEGAAFAIAPIPGLTTAWHPAPARTALPVGVTVQLRLAAAPDDEVSWFGATEVGRSDKWSLAECPVFDPGVHSITVAVRPARDDHDGKGGDGDINKAPPVTHTCVIDAMDVPLEKIRVEAAAVTVSPFDLDENANNMETMRVFMGGRSIATLNRVGENHYVTSIKNPITIETTVDPPEFAPLAEWRIDGKAVQLGDRYYRMIHEPGTHVFSVGPPNASRDIRIDAYSVTITSHKNGSGRIEDGEVVTFEAKTEPPGYQDKIRWISSTRFGTASPVVGYGSAFTVQFVDTWGRNGQQWLGVRADNTTFAQDTKLTAQVQVDTVLAAGDYCLYKIDSAKGPSCPFAKGDIICVDCPANLRCERFSLFYELWDSKGVSVICSGRWTHLSIICDTCPGGGKTGFKYK